MISGTLRWTLALSVALLVHVALYWCVAFTSEPGQKIRRSSRQSTEVQYYNSEVTERSAAFEQQIALFDPRPLLLPTEWNAANAQRLGDFVQEEDAIFPDFDPVLKAEDQAFFRSYGSLVAAPTVEVALDGFSIDPLHGMGRQTLGIAASPSSGVELRARDPRTGKIVSTRVAMEADLAAALRGGQAWEPAVLLGSLREGFFSLGFSVVRSSGYDEIDARLRDLARKELAGSSELPDGAYLIEINP